MAHYKLFTTEIFGYKLRAVIPNGRTWFYAKDIMDVLHIKSGNRKLRNMGSSYFRVENCPTCARYGYSKVLLTNFAGVVRLAKEESKIEGVDKFLQFLKETSYRWEGRPLKESIKESETNTEVKETETKMTNPKEITGEFSCGEFAFKDERIRIARQGNETWTVIRDLCPLLNVSNVQYDLNKIGYQTTKILGSWVVQACNVINLKDLKKLLVRRQYTWTDELVQEIVKASCGLVHEEETTEVPNNGKDKPISVPVESMTVLPKDDNVDSSVPVSATFEQPNLQIFNNSEFGTVRTLTIDGEPWFVGKDVAEALGYANVSKALIDHVDGDDKLNNDSLLSLGQRGGWIINESGLYSLIFSSKLDSAKRFKHWVTSEVLPSIRKTGQYVMPMTIDQRVEIALTATHNLLPRMNAAEERIDKTEQKIYELEYNQPASPDDCERIQHESKKKMIMTCGGKFSKAYQNTSVRQSVTWNIHKALRDKFAVRTYKGIRHCETEDAIEFLRKYQVSYDVRDKVTAANEI